MDKQNLLKKSALVIGMIAPLVYLLVASMVGFLLSVLILGLLYRKQKYSFVIVVALLFLVALILAQYGY